MPPDLPRRRRRRRVYEPAVPFEPDEAGSPRRPPDARPDLADEADPVGLPPRLVVVAGGEAGAARIVLDAELGIFATGDADAAYDAIVVRFGESDEPTLRRLAVNASVEQGWEMILRGEVELAAAKFAEVVRLQGSLGDLRIQIAVETALIGKAFALSEAGREGKSEAILEGLHGRHGFASDGDLSANGFGAVTHRINSLIAAGRFEEAAALAQVADHRRDWDDPGLAGRVSVAVLEACFKLAEAGCAAEFAAARAQLLGYLEPSPNDDPWGRLLWALGWDDEFFERVDPDYDQLIGLADRVARHLDDDEHPTLRALVAGAMFARAKALGEWGEHVNAAAAWTEMLERLSAAERPAQQRVAAAALPLERREFADHRLRAAMDRRARGDFADAVELYDQVVARIDPTDGFELRLRAGRALLGRGLCLDWLGDPGGAALAFEEAIRRYDDAGEAGLLRLVALSRVFLAVVLTERGREGAAAAARRAVARLGAGPGASLLWDWIDAGFESGGGRFGDGNLRSGDAASPGDLLAEDPATISDRIVRCFGPDDPGLRDLVAWALRARA